MDAIVKLGLSDGVGVCLYYSFILSLSICSPVYV